MLGPSLAWCRHGHDPTAPPFLQQIDEILAPDLVGERLGEPIVDLSGGGVVHAECRRGRDRPEVPRLPDGDAATSNRATARAAT